MVFLYNVPNLHDVYPAKYQMVGEYNGATSSIRKQLVKWTLSKKKRVQFPNLLVYDPNNFGPKVINNLHLWVLRNDGKQGREKCKSFLILIPQGAFFLFLGH